MIQRESRLVAPAAPPHRRPAPEKDPWPRRAVRNRLVPHAVLACVLLAGVPSVLTGSNLSLVSTAAIFGLFALSALVLFGWVGLGSFGQAAFFGTGAYAAALLKDQEMNPLLVVLIGALAGMVVALVIAVLAGNSSGIQFAMLTLVLGQVLYQLIFTFRGTLHGDDGIFGIVARPLFGMNLFLPENFWWYAAGVTAVCALLLYGIHRSQLGKTFTAVRDDPVKAAALGTSVRAARTTAFLISGFVGGVAGALYAQQQTGASPALLGTVMSGSVIFMVFIGGTSSMWGPFVGALVYTVLTTRLFQGSTTATVWVGVLLLIVVVLVRGGIMGLVQRGSAAARTRLRRERTV
ncbi:branched-chain amino acid ABC transporter permease [Amycolatopsis benzoatilytica]|uniref:branched-chain amino acid ABC transporter permease n=1 Tax=Amycolatopsis benzoatilytica TaxID=346045 RepID=UPI00035CBBF3|nr:branched-chain amino acid ABC transporter permease [Amycolatopsis benzoatilytica]